VTLTASGRDRPHTAPMANAETATEPLDSTAEGAHALSSRLSFERVSPLIVPTLALLDQVTNGNLPFVWDRWPDLPADFPRPFGDLSRYFPDGLRVTRGSETRFISGVYAEGRGVAVELTLPDSGPHIIVAARDQRTARAIGEAIAARFPEPPDDPSQVSVLVWRSNRHSEISTSEKVVTVPTWSETRENYSRRTRSALDSFMSLRSNATDRLSGRIVLWHGAPGTGKTSAIRALMGEWSSWCRTELLVDPEEVFADPHYLFEVMARFAPPPRGAVSPGWRLLVAEDADRYLCGGRWADNPALDRLLNVADGILGQGCRLIVLLTTNAGVGSVPAALTRPGRCLATVEFERFSVEEAMGGWGPVAVLALTDGGTVIVTWVHEAGGCSGGSRISGRDRSSAMEVGRSGQRSLPVRAGRSPLSPGEPTRTAPGASSGSRGSRCRRSLPGACPGCPGQKGAAPSPRWRPLGAGGGRSALAPGGRSPSRPPRRPWGHPRRPWTRARRSSLAPGRGRTKRAACVARALGPRAWPPGGLFVGVGAVGLGPPGGEGLDVGPVDRQ